MSKEIYLTKGQIAIVDDSDFEWLSQWKWSAYYQPRRRLYYAARKPGKGLSTVRKTVMMHRLILGLEPGDPRQADHKIPSETLDNRRENLRIATCRQNIYNQGCRSSSSTGLKGICLIRSRKSAKKWVARIGVDGCAIFLGYFLTPEEAHTAYWAAAQKYHGEFARR